MNTNKNNTNGINIRPALAMYHANAKGTGCAIRFELHPAEVAMEGYVAMSLAPQITIGNRIGPNPTFPRFDWENRIDVRLYFKDIAQMLQVLRGECESITDGKGLYFRSTAGSTVVRFAHIIDPVSGYVLDVSHSPADGSDKRMARFLMDPAEALGVCEAFVGCMYLVAFGIPRIANVG